MEAGNLLRSIQLTTHRPSGHRLPTCRPFVRVTANFQGGYKGPRPRREFLADWVSNNDDTVRSMPIYVGGFSLLAVLFNRSISGIAPVADASSSQSRADLLAIGLAVTNILTGLVWLSIRPKTITAVPPRGVECERMHTDIPDFVASELIWAWDSLSAATCCRSLVILYDGICILQIGYASASSSNEGEPMIVDTDKLMQGSIFQGSIQSGSQSYLANLSLYPAKSELPFLPSNTQMKGKDIVLSFGIEELLVILMIYGLIKYLGPCHAFDCKIPHAVILQPLGDKGVAILGGDTIRGFTTSDQAWITLMGEKLEATLSKSVSSLPLASDDAR